MPEMLVGSGTMVQAERTDWVGRMGCDLELQGMRVVGRVVCCSGCCALCRVHRNLGVLARMVDKLAFLALLSSMQDVAVLDSLIQFVLVGT